MNFGMASPGCAMFSTEIFSENLFIANVIRKAAKKTIPRSYQNNYIPRWNAECESLCTTFLQSLERDDSSLAATALLAKLSGLKVEINNFLHTSRKTWSRSRHSLCHFLVSADTIAFQLVKNGRYEMLTASHLVLFLKKSI